jgi:hypothetical protein
VLFLFTPASRLAVTLARRARQRATGERAAPDRVRGLRIALAWLAATTALAALPLALRALPREIDAGTLTAVALLSFAVSESVRRGPLRGAMHVAALTAILLAAVTAAAVGAGTSSICGLVEGQGGWPWQWRIATDPAAALAFVCAAYAGLGAGRSHAGGTLADVADHVRRFTVAALLVAVFLGGHQLPSVAGDPLGATPHLRIASVALFVAKGAVLLAASSRIELRGFAWPLAGALTSTGIAAAALVVGAPTWGGIVACSALLALGTAVCLAMARDRTPVISPF